MPRKKYQTVKINNLDSLEGLLQEVYNDACANIKDAQTAINEMVNAAEPADVDDYTKLAKAKTDALKEKSINVKIKLEVAKLQHDSMKHNGDIQSALNERADSAVTLTDFSSVRELLKKKIEKDERSE